MEKNVRLNAGVLVAHGLLRAAKRRLSLWFAGTTTASALVFQSWSLLAMSAAGYAGFVVWDVSRGRFWRETLEELRQRPPALPNVIDIMDATARQFVHRIAQSRSELARVLGARPGALPPRMRQQLDCLRGVEERSLLLVSRLEELSRYLADKNPETLRREIERLSRYGEFTGHASLKIEYGKARATIEAELATFQDLFAARELLVARLETLTGTLEMFPCQVVRLDVAAEQSRDDGDDLLLDPRAWLADAHHLEESLSRCLAQEDRMDDDVQRPRAGARRIAPVALDHAASV